MSYWDNPENVEKHYHPDPDKVKNHRGVSASELYTSPLGVCDGMMHGEGRLLPHELTEYCKNFRITHLPVKRQNAENIN